MTGQIIEITDKSMTISGTDKKLKINQIVKVIAEDEHMARMHNFYHVIIGHISKITGLKDDHVHALARLQIGFYDFIENPETGDDMIILRSTAVSKMDYYKWIDLLDNLWYSLVTNGLTVDHDTVIPPGYLELDYILRQRDKYIEHRKLLMEAKK